MKTIYAILSQILITIQWILAGRDLFARLFHIRQSYYNGSELGEEENYGELKVSFAYRFPVSGHEIIKDRS